MVKSICPECGEAFERFNRATCEDCTPKPDYKLQSLGKASTYERGYDRAWKLLSERARRLQPFCSDCGSTDDLTADHSAETWKRKASGKVLRLKDIDVVCRRCNSERGAARGRESSDRWR